MMAEKKTERSSHKILQEMLQEMEQLVVLMEEINCK